ncbi:MAG TPA: hypothetical protein VM686_42240 [Polyangiaceae bacterium]|nr:hypothetical protein [Polyangiaceae bacterium]
MRLSFEPSAIERTYRLGPRAGTPLGILAFFGTGALLAFHAGYGGMALFSALFWAPALAVLLLGLLSRKSIDVTARHILLPRWFWGAKRVLAFEDVAEMDNRDQILDLLDKHGRRYRVSADWMPSPAAYAELVALIEERTRTARRVEAIR